MLVDSTSNSAAAGVAGAIRQAAGTTGANFQYLLAAAQVESGLNPNSKASTSSATGLFQFIDQTWLATMKDAGPSLGYGKYADAITRSKSGRLTVSDPAMRAEIMNLRKDPNANALMAGAFTKQNAAWLKTKIGREPTEGELYMAHFLGAGGASKLIKAAAQNPAVKAAGLFPRAARSNNAIFYDQQGNARTASQVYGVLDHKLGVARAKTSSSPQTADAVAVPPISPPATATAAAPSAATTSAPNRSTVAAIAALDAPTSVRTIRIRPPAAISSVAPTPASVSPIAAPVAPATSDSSPTIPAAAYPPDAAPGSVFHDLFRTDGRQGVSAAVSELWGTPQRTDAAVPTPVTAVAPPVTIADPPTPLPAAPLGLFGTGHPQRPLVDRRS